MTERATGHFDLQWDEEPPYDDGPGAKLARVTVTKEFHGDLRGTSVTHLIKAMTDVPDSAGYVAIERVKGALHGRSGTFVLQHSAIMRRGDGTLSLTVVPDSGTDELKGLEGSVSVDLSGGGHRYTFDYTLDGDA